MCLPSNSPLKEKASPNRTCAQTPWQGGWFERKRVLKADQKLRELQLSGHDRREKGSCISFQFARNIRCHAAVTIWALVDTPPAGVHRRPIASNFVHTPLLA